MKKLLAILAVLLLGTINVFSQEQTKTLYDAYLEKGNEAYKNKDYELAINWTTKASEYAKTNFGEDHPHYAASLNNLAYCYNSLGDYSTAIKFHKEAIKIIKVALGEDHPYYATTLNSLASCYNIFGDYDQAIELLKQVIEIRKTTLGENHSSYASSLNNLAVCYKSHGKYDLAIELLKQVLIIEEAALGKNHPHYATSLDNLAGCYYKLGDYSTAITLHKQALDIQKTVLGENNHYYATSLFNLASCYKGVGKYISAIELLKQVVEIDKTALGENHPNYALSLNNLADCYSDIGNYPQAIGLLKQAIDIQMTVFGDEHPHYATSLNNLANCYYLLGNYTKAIELHKQAKEIRMVALGMNHPDYAASLNNLAICFDELGDYPTAIGLHKQAIDIITNVFGENHPDCATSLTNLASCYYELGDYPTAIELLEQSLYIVKLSLGDHHLNYAVALEYLASYYKLKGDYSTAIELFRQILEIKKIALGDNHPNYASTLRGFAGCYNLLRDYDQAIELLKQVVSVEKTILGDNHPSYATSLTSLAHNYFEDNNFNYIPQLWSESYNSRKIHTLFQFREMTSSQRTMYWNTNILSDIVIPNNLYSKVLSNDKQSMGLSYNSLLFSKSVILASDIEFDKVIRESGDTVLLEKFEELRTTRAILNTYYNQPITERPEGEVERLETRAEVLEKDLLAGSKEYADFTRRLEIEWEDVQAALGDKDVAIEILAADEHIDEDTPPYYAALVLRKGWDAPKFVELCGAEELQAYFDSESGLAIMYREANSRKLYNLIWGKLAEYINEGDNVYFSPGGLLHQVNVELLQDTDGRLANEKYNLHRVSSTRELCFEKPKIAHSEAVLYGGLMYDMDSTVMVAQSRAVRPEEEHYAMRGLQLDSLRGKLNYLSASKTEVEKISKQMNQHGIKTTLYVEQVGNEESFKALSGKKTPIIHLATHGFFFRNEEAKVKPFFRMMSLDQERPRPDNSLRRSGLAFAGAQKAWDGEEIPKGIDDGVMLAQEIASMDLAGTDLVVLSACETGLGEINSEGVFGLQRAFKKAGVQTLIMSLWKVHDEATALFMQTFYENLFSGKSKRDSFVAAQMALREHRDYGKDPYYWAGFIMLD